MKIYELLDELSEEIEQSPKAVFSGKRSVNYAVVTEILKDIRAEVPAAVSEAEQLLEEKETILKTAKEEAATIIKSAEDELQTRICEDVVVKEAEAKAAELLKLAENNAREITVGAKEYADDILAEMEKYFADYLKLLRKNRLELAGKRKE